MSQYDHHLLSGSRAGQSVDSLDLNILLNIFTGRDYQLGD